MKRTNTAAWAASDVYKRQRVSHAGRGSPDEIYYPVVAELWFENGKLSDAKLYCLSEYVYGRQRVYELEK